MNKLKSRYITITLPDEYDKSNYADLYTIAINPTIKKYKGTNHKCAYSGFTETEHKFKDENTAKKCAKELNILFKIIQKETPYLLDRTLLHSNHSSNSSNSSNHTKLKLGPIASVMPVYYETNGNRGIVRKGSETIETFKPNQCKGFATTLKIQKKYISRPSPPYSANKYCGKTMKGNDNKLYKSIPNKNKVCSWQII